MVNVPQIRQGWQKFSFNKLSTTAVHTSVGAIAGCVFGGYLGLHTVLIDKYRNLLQMYKNGFVTKITPEIAARVNHVVHDVKLSEKYQAYLSPFYVSGFEPVHMGSFKLRTGAYIGIPGNFQYKTKADIERDLIMMQGKPVSWNSESGDLFQDSLILSENAQKFAIAREMIHLDTSYVYNYGAISAGAVYVQYILSAWLNVKTYGHYKPKSFRYTLYSFVGIFTYGLWATATDLLTKYYEEFADSRASSLGIDYARGGVEFYTKLARRNIATRELLGIDGERIFSKYGNRNDEIIRQRSIPVSIRKERAEERVQKMLGVD